MTTNSINNTASSLQVSSVNISGSTITTTTANDLYISTSGTGKILANDCPIISNNDSVNNLGSVTNSWNDVYANGISFNAGGTVFNAYEENIAFTPVLSFGGGTTGITYSTQTGIYYKVAEMIYYSIVLVLTSKGSSTGTARVSLPTSITANNLNPIGEVVCGNINLSAVRSVIYDISTISAGASPITGLTDNSTPIVLTDVEFANNSFLVISGFYWE